MQKPCLAGSDWQAVRYDLEDLANALQGYSTYPCRANEQQQERQQQAFPVRQLSDHVSISCRRHAELSCLTAHEKKINDWLVLEEASSPVYYIEEDILGTSLSSDQRYRMLKSLRITRHLAVLQYDPLVVAHLL